MKKQSLGTIILISIYLIILTLIFWNWIREYSDFVDYHSNISGYNNYSFHSVMQTMALTSVFRLAIFSIPVAIGIFIRKQTGWILITSYLYFFTINSLVFLFENENISNWKSWAMLSIFIIVSVVLIILMTKSKIIQRFHKITNLNKTRLNLKALSIGVILSILLLEWKNHMLSLWL